MKALASASHLISPNCPWLKAMLVQWPNAPGLFVQYKELPDRGPSDLHLLGEFALGPAPPSPPEKQMRCSEAHLRSCGIASRSIIFSTTLQYARNLARITLIAAQG